MTRIQLVVAAEKKGMRFVPFGDGEHGSIVDYAEDGRTVNACVVLWNTGEITRGEGDRKKDPSMSIKEAAQYLGVEQ